jgi:hypothetical protein
MHFKDIKNLEHFISLFLILEHGFNSIFDMLLIEPDSNFQNTILLIASEIS